MILKKSITFLIIMAMLLSSLLIFNSSDAGLSAPPDDLIDGVQYIDGNWVVSGYENYSNEIIYLTGNLIVTGTGMLVFENITLLMNCTVSQGQYQIIVFDGGGLFINDTDNNPATTFDRSLITNSELLAFGYLLQVNKSATFEMRNSEIRNCGLLSAQVGAIKSGPLFKNSAALFENCLITNNANGIVCDSGGMIVRNCSIENNNFYGIIYFCINLLAFMTSFCYHNTISS